jgi:predicted membrane chloride channel (bestrophin family)
MIHYDEDWLWQLYFHVRGSVLGRAAWGAVPSCCVTLALLYWEEYDPGRRDELGLLDVGGSQAWNAITAALAIVLAFRTHRGLGRFWEGTGLLHQMRGEWFDTASNCVTFSISAKKTMPLEVMKFRHTLVRLMSRCHGSALEEIAENSITLQAIDTPGLDTTTLAHMDECELKHKFNKVEVMLHLVQSLITKAHDEGILKIPPPILSRVYQTISRGFVNLLNAKKIVDTRFPFPYAQMIAFLMLLHVVFTPLVMSCLLTSKIVAVLYTFVPICGMFSLNYIAKELENPFGTDDNDLPVTSFQVEFNQCLLMLLHDNSDMIAWTSPDCLLDFNGLLERVHGTHASDDGIVLKRQAPRLSHFGGSNFDGSDFDENHSEAEEVTMTSTVPLESQPELPAPAADPEQIKLAKGIDDFEATLAEWMKSLETQMTSLRENFDTLKNFNETTAEMIMAADFGNLPMPDSGGWEVAISPV